MKKVKGTIVRNGVYYLNLTVPDDIREADEPKQKRESLKTSDPDVAALAVAKAKCELSRRRQAVRDDVERRGLLDNLVDELPPEQRQLIVDAGGLEQLIEHATVSRLSHQFLAAGDPAVDPSDDHDDRSPMDIEMERGAHEAGLKYLAREVNPAAKIVRSLEAQGADLPVPGRWREAATKSVSEVVRPVGNVFGLRELAEKFFVAKSTPTQSREAYRYVVRRFIELHGDIALEDLTPTHLVHYSEEVLKLPVSRRTDLKALPFKQAITRAAAEGLKTVGETTQQNHLAKLKALAAFAVPGYLEVNPWRDVKLHKKRQKFSAKRSTSRMPFTSSQIRSILDHVAATYSTEELDHWAPMLATYHGLRREEIAQIRTDDLFETDGLWCVSVTDEDDMQKLKSRGSLRDLPLHSAVLNAGFIDLVERRSGFVFQERDRWGRKLPNGSRSERQLRELAPDSRGRLSGPYGKRFAHMLCAKLGMDDKTLVFHSFRHAWQDAAETAGIPSSHRRHLAGRANADPVEAGYGKGPLMSALKDSLEKIRIA